MKFTPFMLATLLLLGFASCKKDEITNGNGLIKTVTEDGFTTTYIYDSQNRLIRAESSTGSVDELTYSPNLVTIVAEAETTYLHLNSINQTTMLISNNDTTFYVYNSDGTMNYEAWQTDTTFYTWSGSNIATSTSNGLTTTYTYYAGQENTLSNANLGLPYLDATSEDLVKSSVCTGCGNSSEYSYEFDNEGRVTKRTETIMPGGFSLTATYTYY